MSRISGSDVHIKNAKSLIEVAEGQGGYTRTYFADGADTHNDLQQILNYAADHGLSGYVSEVRSCRNQLGSNFDKSVLKKSRQTMAQIAQDYIDYEYKVVRSFDSKFTEGYETVLRNMSVGEGEDFKSKYFTKDVEHDDYSASRYDVDYGTPNKYITKEFMTLDEIMDKEGVDNIPLISDYMNIKMSDVLEASYKNGTITQDEFDKYANQGDYASFKETFGSFYHGSLGEYQYLMGTQDEKWYSAKRITEGAMKILSGGVLVLGVISIFVSGGTTLPLVLGYATTTLGVYGTVKYGYQFVTEKDWMTGRPLDDQEKWISGLQAVASMITLGRGVGLTTGALAQSDNASNLVKSTASFFKSSGVKTTARVLDYGFDLGTGYVSYKYGGKPLNEVLLQTGFALGINAAVDIGMYKVDKIAKHQTEEFFANMSDDEFIKYLKDHDLSFSDFMDSKDASRYNEYWSSILKGTHLPPNVDLDDYKRMLVAQGKLNELEVLQMKSKIKGTGSKRDIITDGSHLVDGKLQPNSKYRTGEFDYIYESDELGRLKEWEANDLQFTTRESRLKHNPNTPGKLPGDHAGHIAADRFGGSQDVDNLVSQLSGVNLSDYKKIENQWANALEANLPVSTKVTIIYEGSNLRPSAFNVEYTIDGEFFSQIIPNQ